VSSDDEKSCNNFFSFWPSEKYWERAYDDNNCIGIDKDIKTDPKNLFSGILKKNRVEYLDFCDLFAKSIERTYASNTYSF
jgi:hypothetical protein